MISKHSLVLLMWVVVITALFPIFGNIAVNNINPILVVGLWLFISSIPCLCITSYKNNNFEISLLLRWRLLPIAIILAIIVQSAWFLGLAHTSANNAAIISKSELLFTFIIYSIVLWKEKYTISALLWAFLIISGIIIVLLQDNFQISLWDFILLGVFAVIPFWNYLVQRGKEIVSSYTLVWVKNFISGSILICISITLFELPSQEIFITMLPYIFFQWIFWFFLHHVLWAELISKESLAKMLTFTAPIPLLSFLFSYLFLWEIITLWQLSWFFIVLTWVYLILTKKFLHCKTS